MGGSYDVVRVIIDYGSGTGTSATWSWGIAGNRGIQGAQGFQGIAGSGSQGGVSKVVRGATFVNSSGSAIATPVAPVYINFPTAGTISNVTVLTSGGTGSCVVDIWQDTYANYPPTVADTLTAAAKPTISSGIKYTNSTLTGWNTTINSGNVLAINLDSTSTFNVVSVYLEITQ